jgi:alkylation response protein AidB-like acyl-CoA dehydrogenase
MPSHRAVYNDDQRAFRDTVRAFLRREVAPHFPSWEANGMVDRSFWTSAGAAGLLCAQVPAVYGGGDDFRFNAVVIEETSYAGYGGPAANLTGHSDVATSYIQHYASGEIRGAWLPRMVSGEAVCAIAISEPAAGSDLRGLRARAVRDGDEYVVNGSKTFVSNGQHCDIVVTVVQTGDSAESREMSLLLIEADRPGFIRGTKLSKIGHASSDTSELFFDNVRVPAGNLIGERGTAMRMMMTQLPQERLSIAVASMAAAQKAYDITRDYVADRKAFGTTVGAMQNTRFRLADLKADLTVGWAFLDQCLGELAKQELTAERTSVAKLWVTEMQGRVVDQCLQFFGGYGFMHEYEISRLFVDARVQRIYGGTSEIMREIISRNL